MENGHPGLRVPRHVKLAPQIFPFREESGKNRDI